MLSVPPSRASPYSLCRTFSSSQHSHGYAISPVSSIGGISLISETGRLGSYNTVDLHFDEQKSGQCGDHPATLQEGTCPTVRAVYVFHTITSHSTTFETNDASDSPAISPQHLRSHQRPLSLVEVQISPSRSGIHIQYGTSPRQSGCC